MLIVTSETFILFCIAKFIIGLSCGSIGNAKAYVLEISDD